MITGEQIDVLHFRQDTYTIGRSTSRLPFLPSDVGIKTHDHGAGYDEPCYSEYSVIEDRLYLTRTVMVIDEPVWQQAWQDRTPELFGVPPTFLYCKTGFWLFSKLEPDSSRLVFNPWQPLPFSGGLLIGNKYVSEGHVTGYAELWEVIFEQGKLVHAADHSKTLEEIRALMYEPIRKLPTKTKNEVASQQSIDSAEEEESRERHRQKVMQKWNDSFKGEYFF